MIKIIISSIPILTLGYIIYDFFMRRHKKKKDLELQKIEFMRLLGVRPSNMDSTTHTINILVHNNRDNINTTFTICFMESLTDAPHQFYNPILGRWERCNSIHYVLIMLEDSTERFMGGYNHFRLLGTTKLQTLRPTKKLKKHKLTD